MVGKPSLTVAVLAVVFGMVNNELLQHVRSAKYATEGMEHDLWYAVFG